jgi:hypothetical protein
MIEKQPQLIHRVNVLPTNTQRTVYGYRLYNIEDAVQLVFDSVNYESNSISVEVKGPNEELINDVECKYSPDYLAVKFTPQATGSYVINFNDKSKDGQLVASSPYKVIVHEDYKEILRCLGVYDLTRLTISAAHLPTKYELNKINVIVKGMLLLFLFLN